MFRTQSITLLIGLTAAAGLAMAQAPAATHPTPPTRGPRTPGYVTATELPGGSNSPTNADGNFIISSARTDLRGGRPAMSVPTATPCRSLSVGSPRQTRTGASQPESIIATN
jgi:hypothetical protein